MNQTQLKNKVKAILIERIDANEIIEPSWLCKTVVALHPDIRGKDKDFYLLCSYEHLEVTVREILREYKPSIEGGDEEQLLPGFSHLQRAYAVKRDGMMKLVPTQQLTDQELHAKAEEYRALGDGCYAHSRELERYIKARKRAA